MLLFKRCGAVAALSMLAAVTAFAAGEGEAAMAGDDVIEVHTYDTVSHSAGSEAGTAQQVLDDVQAYIEEHTGVRVFTHRLPRQTYQEQVTLLLASNDPMDVIAGIRVADFQPKGALKAINQWFDQIPNTRKAWTDIAWAKVSTTDGQTWAIPRGEVVTSWPVWIRGEFLRQYGLEYPTTVDELEQVLDVFKRNDPIGGGQTQVMVTSYAPHLRMVMAGGWLPDGYGPWLDSADGKVKPPELHPGFQDFIARMRDWYAKGYIWPDSFTIPASEVRPVIYQGQFASTAYWTSAVGIGKYTILKNFPDADPVYQRPIMGPAGMIETLNPAGTHGWVFPARSPDANTEAMLIRIPCHLHNRQHECPVVGEVDIFAVEPQDVVRYGVEEPFPERAQVLPDVTASSLSRPVEAHRIVGRLVGTQHRSHGHVGTAFVLRRQPQQNPIANQGVIRIEGHDDRRRMRAHYPDSGYHVGQQTAATPVADDGAVIAKRPADYLEMLGEHGVRCIVEHHRTPSWALLPDHGVDAATQAPRRNVAARHHEDEGFLPDRSHPVCGGARPFHPALLDARDDTLLDAVEDRKPVRDVVFARIGGMNVEGAAVATATRMARATLDGHVQGSVPGEGQTPLI